MPITKIIFNFNPHIQCFISLTNSVCKICTALIKIVFFTAAFIRRNLNYMKSELYKKDKSFVIHSKGGNRYIYLLGVLFKSLKSMPHGNPLSTLGINIGNKNQY